ncbi:putative PIF1 DNA helicase/replication protein A1-like protein [Tanacetum coccineum]
MIRSNENQDPNRGLPPQNDHMSSPTNPTPPVILSLVTIVDNQGNTRHLSQSACVTNPANSTRHVIGLNNSTPRHISESTNTEQNGTNVPTSVYRTQCQQHRMTQYADSGDATYTCAHCQANEGKVVLPFLCYPLPLLAGLMDYNGGERSKFSSGVAENNLRSLVQDLITMLDIHNPLVPSFRMAKDRFVQSSIQLVTLRLIGDDNLTESHDVIVEEHSNEQNRNGVKRISELYLSFMDLQYPLLFPYGEDRTLHKARHLFHTFCVDAYTAFLDHDLDWYKRNQNTIRSELYNGLHDRVTKEETKAEFLGRKFILPSTFTGGPKHMIQQYQDAMAICRWAGPPDLFFQKRRLPHCYALIFLHERDKISSTYEINHIIFAVLPSEIGDPIGYEMHYRSVAIERLIFYEEGCNRVYFRDDDEVDNVIERETTAMPKFTDWMKANEMYSELGNQEVQYYTLLELEAILNGNNKSLHDFPELSQIDYMLMNIDGNSLYGGLYPQQRDEYDNIMQAVNERNGGLFFVYGCGGTRKTYLWKTIISWICSLGRIVLSVASSGIASLLLPYGRTAHSRFCIPMKLDNESCCGIDVISDLADLIRAADLIIWDEAPLQHRHAFEAVDQAFCNICMLDNPNADNQVFGGKVVVLGGDFQQILPVILNASRAVVVSFAVNKSSSVWDYCKVFVLSINMRLRDPRVDVTNEDEMLRFHNWLIAMGDGRFPSIALDGEDDATWITIPEDLLILVNDNPVRAIVSSTFPDLLNRIQDINYLKERCILSPTNDVVDKINSHPSGALIVDNHNF